MSYNEKDFDGRDKTIWCLPMYLPVQFVQAMIQYHRCRDNACETAGCGLLDASLQKRHPQLLSAWFDSTLLVIELVIAGVLVMIAVLTFFNGVVNFIIRLWSRHSISKKGGRQ